LADYQLRQSTSSFFVRFFIGSGFCMGSILFTKSSSSPTEAASMGLRCTLPNQMWRQIDKMQVRVSESEREDGGVFSSTDEVVRAVVDQR